jgi:poly(A) polymerase
VKSAPPRVTEELAQALRGGHSLPTLLLMREVGLLDALLPELAAVLRQIDPDHSRGTGHFFWALLEVLDAERRRGRRYEDALLFSLLFVPIVRARVREAFPHGEPDLGKLAVIIEDVVAPLALRMALPRAATDRIKQGLAIIGKLSHRPDARVASRRVAFREAFPMALDLFELTAMATGIGADLVRDWRTLQTRIERGRASGEIPAPPTPPPRRRRRRGGRGRPRASRALKAGRYSPRLCSFTTTSSGFPLKTARSRRAAW